MPKKSPISMPNRPTRRTFLKLSATATPLIGANLVHAFPANVSIALITDNGTLVSAESVQWALAELRRALTEKGVTLSAASSKLSIVVAPPSSSLTTGFGMLPAITQPETTALIPGSYRDAPAILVTGIDARGLVYGLLELADRVQLSDDPLGALHFTAPIVETTPNKTRSVARAFLSEIEDKPWFYDRVFWTRYLDTLAYARFNRFNLAFGFGYDFLCRFQWRAKLHSLRLWRLLRPARRNHASVPRLAWNTAPPSLGRSGARRWLRSRRSLLRSGRHGTL